MIERAIDEIITSVLLIDRKCYRAHVIRFFETLIQKLDCINKKHIIIIKDTGTLNTSREIRFCHVPRKQAILFAKENIKINTKEKKKNITCTFGKFIRAQENAVQNYP